MKNLINKSLLLLAVLATGIVQTTLGVNASAYYTRYTHEFLGYLGHNNPTRVPISKIMPHDAFYKGAAGYAGATGIHINEDLLARLKLPEACRLFTCAHEATHFALGHPYQVKRKILEIEQEADVEAARMLCRNGHRWIVEGHVSHLRKLVQAGRGNHTDGHHPTTQQQYKYLSQVLATNQGNAIPAKNPARNPKAKPVKPAPARNPVKAKPARGNAPRKNANNPKVVRRVPVAKKALQGMQAKKAAAQRIRARRR